MFIIPSLTINNLVGNVGGLWNLYHAVFLNYFLFVCGGDKQEAPHQQTYRLNFRIVSLEW